MQRDGKRKVIYGLNGTSGFGPIVRRWIDGDVLMKCMNMHAIRMISFENPNQMTHVE